MTTLDFSGNSLAGPVSGLLLLQGLNFQHLSLASNSLWGTLPAAIFSPAMVSVDLRGNFLTGRIPAALWQPMLRDVDLGANQLTGTIAAAAGLLGADAVFVDIRLDGNRLTGTVPASLSSLSNLEVLDLSLNLLTGHLPEIGNAAGALMLGLAGNDFDCPLPQPAALFRVNASASCTCRAGLYGNDASCRFCPVGTANSVDGTAAGGWVTACAACASGLVAESIGSKLCAEPAAPPPTTTMTAHPADDAVEHYDWGVFAGGVWLLAIMVASAAAFGQEFGGGHHPHWHSKTAYVPGGPVGGGGGEGRDTATVMPMPMQQTQQQPQQEMQQMQQMQQPSGVGQQW